MDHHHQTLLTAASSGDVKTLHQLLELNPFILSDHILINLHENPLTVATKANHLAFVLELLRLSPQLATQPNQDGVRPLDVASAYGNIEVVREILEKSGPLICRLAGRDGRTAVHYAAMNGRGEIIDEVMRACLDSIEDVTSFGETALHLAVKNYKVEALGRMLQWLDHERVDDRTVGVVNWGDRDGNTVLHLAVLRKQLENVEMLLAWNNKAEKRLQLNTPNKKGLTPLDIADLLIESSTDVHLRKVLHHAGGAASSEFHVVVSENPNSDTTKNPQNQKQKPQNWLEMVKHFEFQWQRDSPGEARETLLVVAALIATVTFEAGINPPSYLFESSSDTNVTVSGSNLTESWNEIQRIGSDSSSVASITVFLVANSVALSTAISIVDYLTGGLPFQRELRVSISGMIFAYCWSLANTKPTGKIKTVLLIFAICMPLFLRLLPLTMAMLRKYKGRRNS